MPALVEPAGPGAGTSGSARPGRWADLRVRTLSALVLVPAVLLCIVEGTTAWSVLMVVSALGLGLEWALLCVGRPLRLAALIPAGVLMLTAVRGLMGDPAGGASILFGGTVLTALLARQTGAGERGALLPLGVLAVGGPLLALIVLREGPGGMANVLFMVAVVWASDIGAYGFGRLLGGPKLAPAISPSKTWAGAAGGLLAAVLAGGGLAIGLDPGLTSGAAGRVAGLALLLAVSGQIGDLVESWFKRRIGVKDSGRLIPGHGGLLDRLDGVLAASLTAALIAGAWAPGAVMWN